MREFKLIKIVVMLLVVNVLFTSCTNDFVDILPKDENSEAYFNNEDEYQKALTAAYDLLNATYVNVMLGEIASDNTRAGGESATDVPGFQEIDDMRHTSNNANLRDIWSWMFAALNRTNYIMEFKDKTDFPNRNQVIGETRFLRAYFSFELVKWFGDIPYLVDKRIQFGDQFKINRTPKSEVYKTMEADLIFASENLSATAAEAGRATKGAAQALLGKVYLYQKKYSEAASSLDAVIAGPYTLVDDYNKIFEVADENNSESIFEVQYTDEDGGDWACLQCSNGNIAVGFSGVRNYDGPFFDSGFSFNLPTQEVVDAFQTGDVRKDVAILDIKAWAAANNATYDEAPEDRTGYYNRKYIPRKGDKNTPAQALTDPTNYRAIRLADVLLMAAEANNKIGNDAKALGFLNQVRARAKLTPLAGITGQDLLDAIFRERRVELIGEGHRFFDLVRTERAAAEITGFQAGKHEVFPIPLIEIQLAGNHWAQNPGY